MKYCDVLKLMADRPKETQKATLTLATGEVSRETSLSQERS